MIEGLVSIIMPSFNSSKYIKESIESVIKQSYTNWELLIVDDKSKDNSLDVIKKHIIGHDRINLISLVENVGAAKARNVAIEQAKGQYIAFLDSDDLWVPLKLEKQINFMKRTGSVFVFSDYDLINEDGVKLGKTIKTPSSITYNQYLKNTIIGCLTVIIDVSKVGQFRMPIIRTSQDMALWLLIMKRGIVANGINENLASYRLVSNSNSSKKIKAAKDVWTVYREIEGLSFFYSLLCFMGYAFNAIIKRI